MSKQIIVAAGRTGNLGGWIVKVLLEKWAEVRALVRSTSDKIKISSNEQMGAKVILLDMSNENEIATACIGATFVVSVLEDCMRWILVPKSIIRGCYWGWCTSAYSFRLFIRLYEIYWWRKSKFRSKSGISYISRFYFHHCNNHFYWCFYGYANEWKSPDNF